MKARDIEVNIDETRLISVDGVGHFTDRLGTYYGSFGEDAEPIIEWGQRAKDWVSTIRSNFGTRLRHVAIISKYKPGQFGPTLGKQPVSAISFAALGVDETYRHIIIDDEHLVTKAEKHFNDPTTSEEVMREIRQMISMVLIGATTTTCIDGFVSTLLQMMKRKDIALQRIIMARNGVVSRKSRKKDEKRILDLFEREPNILVVPRLEDIRWFIPPDISKRPVS